MQDRVATYPGRWKLTPVAGQTDVYDFERADDPITAGTPLNKATFLTDATAAAIAALTGNTPALPTEALDELAGIFAGMGVTDIAHVEFGSYVGTGASGSSNPNSLTLNYEPRFLCVTRAGANTASAGSGNFGIWQYDNDKMYQYNTVSVADTTISWYSTINSNRATDQLNTSGTTYYYLAIGVN